MAADAILLQLRSSLFFSFVFWEEDPVPVNGILMHQDEFYDNQEHEEAR
jgi:hypothetical protein